MTSKQKSDLNELTEDTAEQVDIKELAKGWLRYEKIRTLNAVQFAKLQRRNLEGRNWDDMIDELIIEELESASRWWVF
jgi:hypothetical protein